jgi:hypothetical protein
MRPRDDVNEVGCVVGMAWDAKPRGVLLLFHFHRWSFEFTENALPLTGI